MSYLDDARKLSWYCEECAASDSPGPACHPIGAHNEGVSWPIQLETDRPPPRYCWCGRWLPLIGAACHDPYSIYTCLCGLHLFATKETVSPGRWAWHLNHIAAFQADVQAKIDAAYRDWASAVPDWAADAVAVLAEYGLIDVERQTNMIIVKQLAGCLVRGCPVRFASGESRLCNDHAKDGGVYEAAEALGIELGSLARQAPVGRRAASRDQERADP